METHSWGVRPAQPLSRHRDAARHQEGRDVAKKKNGRKHPNSEADWVFQMVPYIAIPHLVVFDKAWEKLNGGSIKLLLYMRASVNKSDPQRYDPTRLPYSYSNLPDKKGKAGVKVMSRDAYYLGIKDLLAHGFIEAVEKKPGRGISVYNVVSRKWIEK